MLSLTFFESLQGPLPVTAALAAIALIGYLFGQRTRQSQSHQADPQLFGELSRAREVAKELRQIAQRIRTDVALHQTSIEQFNQRVQVLESDASVDAWQKLSAEAESLLAPTMKLTSNLSLAYDQLRKQSSQLMNFAGSRTDPVTGVHNRRALEEQLEVQFSLHEENNSRFALTLISLEVPANTENDTEQQTDLLPVFAELLEASARNTDFVARYSNDEFVVLMPQTSLAGANVFSQRLLNRATEQFHGLVFGGIVEVQMNDSPQQLLRRADSALYSARANGRSCLYQHNGISIRRQEANPGGEPEGVEPVATSASCHSEELQAAAEAS